MDTIVAEFMYYFSLKNTRQIDYDTTTVIQNMIREQKAIIIFPLPSQSLAKKWNARKKTFLTAAIFVWLGEEIIVIKYDGHVFPRIFLFFSFSEWKAEKI